TESSLTGSTPAVVYTPHHFAISDIRRTSDAVSNPGANATNGTVFIAAGEPFSVTVTAQEKNNAATPNFGRETPAESVELQTELQSYAGAPNATHNPNIGKTVGFGTFSNGIATGTDFTWPEVGIIKLIPHVADGNYLDAGDTTGTKTGT